MKYYVYRTEIDTMSGHRHSSYLKAIDSLKERVSLLVTFYKFDEVDSYPVGTWEDKDDEAAIKSFHDGYRTEHIKGCGNSHAFMEYTLYNGEEVDKFLSEENSDLPDCLAYSVTDAFDEPEDDDEEDD